MDIHFLVCGEQYASARVVLKSSSDETGLNSLLLPHLAPDMWIGQPKVRFTFIRLILENCVHYWAIMNATNVGSPSNTPQLFKATLKLLHHT